VEETAPWRWRLVTSSSSTSNEVENENNECDDEQQMDKPASDMKGKSAAPKEQEEDGDDE
jgi:hypothetical protein